MIIHYQRSDTSWITVTQVATDIAVDDDDAVEEIEAMISISEILKKGTGKNNMGKFIDLMVKAFIKVSRIPTKMNLISNFQKDVFHSSPTLKEIFMTTCQKNTRGDKTKIFQQEQIVLCQLDRDISQNNKIDIAFYCFPHMPIGRMVDNAGRLLSLTALQQAEC